MLIVSLALTFSGCKDKCKDVTCENDGKCNTSDGKCECTDFFSGEKCADEKRTAFYGTFTGTLTFGSTAFKNQRWTVSRYTSDATKIQVSTAGTDVLYLTMSAPGITTVSGDNSSSNAYTGSGNVSGTSLYLSGSIKSTSSTTSSTVSFSYSGSK